jgi:glucose/arabinose dehydrogenase
VARHVSIKPELARFLVRGSCTGFLINKNLEELRRELLLVDLRRRIRDVKQGRDGLLYLLTDEADAARLRIEPAA